MFKAHKLITVRSKENLIIYNGKSGKLCGKQSYFTTMPKDIHLFFASYNNFYNYNHHLDSEL